MITNPIQACSDTDKEAYLAVLVSVFRDGYDAAGEIIMPAAPTFRDPNMAYSYDLGQFWGRIKYHQIAPVMNCILPSWLSFPNW